MAYTVSSSEKLRKSGAEMETKAMLYLMNFHEDSDEIYYFVVDFFNDLTGMNRTSRALWDMQSKGAKNSSPKAIGGELVTLYKNYISEFDFKAYILFLGGVTGSLRIDESKNIFGIENIKTDAIKKLKEGLIEEAEKKTYIPNDKIDDSMIEEFIKEVRFVVDDKTASDYIRPIIGTNISVVPTDDILTSVFNEIRDKQSSKKNISIVEGVTIDNMSDALNYCRHLTISEIKMFVIQRVLNWDFLKQGLPTGFLEVIRNFPTETVNEKIEQCQQACCRALFNNNCADGYWRFFGFVVDAINNNRTASVNEIYNIIPDGILDACPDLETLSFKYFIAVIKGGI